MTISIWIFILISVVIGFLVFYKKNRINVQKPDQTFKKSKKELALTDLDKLLDNVTTKDKMNPQKNDENSFEKNEEKKLFKKDKDESFNVKDSIKGSIILKRKKKD